MTAELLHRPARTSRPLPPPKPETLAPPPVGAERSGRGMPWQALLPVGGALASGLVIVLFRSSNPAFLMVAALLLVVALAGGIGVAVSQRGGAARQRRAERENYLDYLEKLRARMRARGRELRAAALHLDPAPEALLEVVRDPARLWERRPGDPDFLAVRVGVGDQVRLPLVVPPEQNPVQPYDPILLGEALTAARRCELVRGVPVTALLTGVVAVVGTGGEGLAAVRSLLLQLAGWHAPEDLALAVAYPPAAAADWRGVDLLPHVTDPGRWTGPLPLRRVAPSAAELGALLADDLAERARRAALGRHGWSGPTPPRLVVLLDDRGRVATPVPLPAAPADLGVTVVHLVTDRLHEPSDTGLRITVHDGLATVDELRPAAPPRPAGPLPGPALPSAGPTEPSSGPAGPSAGPAGPSAGPAGHFGPSSGPAGHFGPSSGPAGPFGPSSGPGGPSAGPAGHFPGPSGPDPTLPADPPPAGPAERVVADLTGAPLFEAVARTLAGRRLNPASVRAAGATGVAVTDLLGLAADRPGPARSPRTGIDFLRVPIGLDDLGAPVLLDLKESAQAGMGPHGLCVGATGSGKSELLRTLILSLALTHPPEDLALVLVDYKGGAAFAPFAPLPHVAGIIDNLAEDSQLTERARVSIAGEVVRRQELLRDAGSSPSITHYRQLRATRPELPALPHLLLVIDEFGELLTADPDFVDLLLTIGRIGRSIGVHLLLSSQRIEAGKLRGLETYLSYRIGLRTFSESESATILDTKDAFHLPPVPGYGYLKVDTTVYRRFRAAYVSGARTAAGPRPATPTPVLPVPRYGTQDPTTPPGPTPAAGPVAGPVAAAGPVGMGEPVVGPTLLTECVAGLDAPGRRVAPVWLAPLPARVALPAGPRGGLRVPLGLVDDPGAQRQDTWSVDLARGGGHLAVIGAPQSGRSTLLRTLAVSAALTHTPQELSLYGLDLAGGGLRAIEAFPHVGGVATRAQRDRLQRVLEELLGMLAARERVFAEHGIDSMTALRAEHAAGRVPELVAPDVVLLVDGASQLRTDFEALEEPLLQLLRTGSSYGFHVVLALTRWNDLRMAHQPLVGTRLELRVNDPIDSVVGRKLAALIRPDQPGRVLTEESRFAQVAEPGPVRELAAAARVQWTGPVAPPVRLLPARLHADDLPPVTTTPPTVPLGLRQDTMTTACLELGDRDQHLIALGDPGAGKTTLLGTVVGGLVDRLSPDELVFAVMDLRGRAARAVPEAYLGAHATSATLARGLAESVAVELARRSLDRSAAATARRVVVLVDDHDMIGSGDRDLLRPLLPYLPSARDLGLHLLLTRPVAGATRALYDPVLQAVRDTGGSLLLMSGEASEGQVLPRTYAEPLPPGRGRFVRRGEPPFLLQVATRAGHPAPAPDPDDQSAAPEPGPAGPGSGRVGASVG